MRRRGGFTLFEVVTVLGIIAMLAAISFNEFSAAVMRSKRTEAVEGLSALDQAQQAYYLQHGVFADSFAKLDWSIEGGVALSPTEYRGGRYVYVLSQPFDPDGYYCTATAQLDEDDTLDVLEIYDL
jgi:prepilin-type N-terminal cleavage/methylation domain-containing protein